MDPLTAFWCQFGVAVAILIALSLIEKRKSFKLHWCYSRPGLVVPLNLLDSYENRSGFALSFGVLSTRLVNWFVSQSVTSPIYIKLLLLILYALLVGLLAYPLFACQITKNRTFGCVAGYLYCCTWLTVDIYTAATTATNAAIPSMLLIELPEWLCIIALLFKFTKRLYINIRDRTWRNVGDCEETLEVKTRSYRMVYVRNLLNRTNQQKRGNFGMLVRIRRWFYVWKPDFRYSTKIVCTFAVCFISIYILSCWFIFLLPSLKTYYWSLLQPLKTYYDWKDLSLLAYKAWHLFEGCYYSAVVLASLRSLVILLNMLSSYRKHVMKLRRGDRSWLPESLKTQNSSSTRLMMGNMKYPGIQIGYTLWGWMMSFLVIFLISLGLASLTYQYYSQQIILPLLKNAWPPALMVMGIYLLQLLAVKYLFLRERGKIMTVNNRRAYHILSYFMFIYNVFFGIFSGIFRILCGAIVGMMFFERLHQSILPRALERFDRGYAAYLGCLLTEHSHANPVMRVFVYILQDNIFCLKTTRSDSVQSSTGALWHNFKCLSDDPTQQVPKGSKCAINRWHLVYTLLRNPSLVKYRKFKQAVREKESSVLISLSGSPSVENI